MNVGMRVVVAMALAVVSGRAGDPGTQEASAGAPPNVVIIFTDDQGYADVGVFGAQGFRTPNLDRMAAEGIRLTSFHVAQAVCSASRAALLTGCYPNRIGIHGALGPGARHGIHPDETTLAELLKSRGHATAIFGKWHLGHRPEFLPTRHGFDEYWGIPYSNDMWPNHPRKGAYPPLPLIEGDRTIETDPDQDRFTSEITRRGVDFIRRNKDRPFFLYLAHPMPHVPLHCSDAHRGKTPRGLYGDVIEEIDASVGSILAAIDECGLDRNTVVIFASDNGPWINYGDHAGSAGPLREAKGTSWEGGIRVPFIARWPGRIPAGATSDDAVMSIDLLPTIASWVGGELPARKIDGMSIAGLLEGQPGAHSPQEAYAIYYHTHQLQAVIAGRWKLVLPHRYRTLNGRPGGTGGAPVEYEQRTVEKPELYDLRADIGETEDRSLDEPEVLARMLEHVERFRADLGDSLVERDGPGRREPGRVSED